MRQLQSPFIALVLATGMVLAGCAAPAPRPTAAATRPQPNDVHWYRAAAEQRAIYAEVYGAASEAARTRSAALPAGSWGVILDIDETVLDNSEYERRLAVNGQSYTAATWDAWVRERSATALPGAKDFLDTVRDRLHGRVVLVSNRSEAQCPDTEANLRAQGLHYDLVLCDATGNGDKNPRFQAVGAGAAGLPALDVVLYVGDNIQDFPGLDQQHPGDPALFGSRYFVLPNPLYGSWQKLPER